MAQKDYYDILWVERHADEITIKKSYRSLAMKYHPDRTGGDKESEIKFKEVNEAYSVLSDAWKKQQYDTYGSVGWNSSWFGGGWFAGEDISDIFNSFFGGWFGGGGSRTQARRETRGEDLEYDISIDLKTSIYGGKETIKFNKREICTRCDGVGGTWKKSCSTCQGWWQVTYTSQSPFGRIQQTRTCPDCSGSWELFEETCSECRGEKRNLKKHTIDLDIPAGIDDGMVIKLSWEGNDGIGTKASWDLYVRFHVQTEEKWLSRDWNDLHYDIEIDFIEAVLWTKKELHIPIIGKRTITIDAGTQNEYVIKISSDGVKDVQRDAKWDLLIHVSIPVPKKISHKERELYAEIAKEKKLNVLNKKWVLEKLFG